MSDDGGAGTRRRGSAATIYDVAELAGVSPSTVSRALSKPGRISAPTEAKIRAAAEELDFRINPVARALHTGRTRTLALIVADITNPVVFDLIRGAEHAASDADYTLVIAESQESAAAESNTIQRILPSVDGIILATTRLESSEISDLAGRKPVVLVNRAVEGVAAVLPDVETGVSSLVEHLSALGHRSLAYLSGPSTSWISERRWEFLLQQAEARGLSVVEIGPNAPTIEGGRAAARRVKASPATAVIAFNDLIAIGLMEVLGAEGVRVPDDLSVTGFDDIFGSQLIVPALTTVRSQLELAGRRAASHLIASFDAPGTADALEELSTELIVRGSTGPAPRDR